MEGHYCVDTSNEELELTATDERFFEIGMFKCNDSDVNDTAADDVESDTRFHIFKRDASKKTYSIQEIIDHVAMKKVGDNEELLDGSSLTGYVDEVTATNGYSCVSAASCDDYWDVYFSFLRFFN